MHRTLLRPLPYPDADRIVRIFEPSAEGRTLRRDDECAAVLNEAPARRGFLGRRALGRGGFVAGHPDPSESWASCARCGYI